MMKAAAAVAVLPVWATAQAVAVDAGALEGKWSLPEWIPFVGGLGTDGGGDSHDCGPWDQAPPLSVPEDQLRWCCETKGVWCPLIAMPTTTTERPFDCRALKADDARQAPTEHSADDALKRLWCCQYERVGCPKDDEAATTSAPHDCHEGVADWQGSWPEQKKRWCCAHGALGCEDDTEEVVGGTTAPDVHQENQSAAASCDVQCTVKDFAAPCHEWVRLGVQQEFAFEADPCARARDLVARECPQCAACNLDSFCAEPAAADDHAAETGDPVDPGTPARSSRKYDCHGAGPSQDKKLWPEDKKAWCCEHHLVACFGCGVQCVVEGVSAACAERVAWSRDNQFGSRRDACSVAHDQVSEDCPVCSGCELGEVCPEPNATAGSGEPSMNATDPQVLTSTGTASTITTTSLEVTTSLLVTTRTSTTVAKTTMTTTGTTTRVTITTAEPTPVPTAGTTEPVPAPVEPEPEPYDCEVPGGNAEAIAQLWSPRRRAWCCERHQQGCAKEEEEPFDCTDGVLEWEHKWPFQKVQWCCRHYEVGCADSFQPGRLFDRSGQAPRRPESGWASAISRVAAPLLAGAVTCVALYAIARTSSIARRSNSRADGGGGADGGGRGGPRTPPWDAVRAEREALLEGPV